MEKKSPIESLFEKRCIVINGKLEKKHTDEMMSLMRQMYDAIQKPPIHLVINCPGVEWPAVGNFHSFLRSFPGTTHGYANGSCYSGGNIILAGCDKRYSTKFSQFLMHYPNWGPTLFCDDIDQRVKFVAAQMKEWMPELLQLYKNVLTISEKELRFMLENSDKYMLKFGPKKAEEIGLIHRVLRDDEPLPWF